MALENEWFRDKFVKNAQGLCTKYYKTLLREIN